MQASLRIGIKNKKMSFDIFLLRLVLRRERDSKRRALAQARGDTLLAPDFSPIHQIHYPRNPPFVRITLLVQGQAGIAGYCFGLWQLELAQRMP